LGVLHFSLLFPSFATLTLPLSPSSRTSNVFQIVELVFVTPHLIFHRGCSRVSIPQEFNNFCGSTNPKYSKV